ncbi:MAG: MMPL family transporter [bacterium]|nr:MMPL family transporter [bacterium]
MRAHIESLLEALGHLAYRRAWPILLATLLLIAAGATQIAKIEVKTSIDDFLNPNDATKIAYDEFLEQFGRDDIIMIVIEAERLFSLPALERVRDLHQAIEDEVPWVREVQSLVNLRETRGEDDTLVVGDFLEDWPTSEAEVEDLKARALANPLYVDFFLTRDGDLTLLTVELEAFAEEFDDASAFSGFDDDSGEAPAGDDVRLTSEQERAAVAALEEIVERFDTDGFRLHAGGAPVLNTAMMRGLVTDVVTFTILSTGLIALFLVLVLRRALGVLIPLSVSLLAVTSTLGVMGTFGIPFLPISEIVPSFLLAIGVGASVHLIAIFLQRVEAGASREDAIAGALAHSGLPIIMTGLTTAGGLASFSVAALRPVAMFGVVAPLGILLCLVLTLLLTPALLAIAPMRQRAPRPKGDASLSIRLLTAAGEFALARSTWVLITCAALTVVALIGILQLKVSFDSLEWFPDEMPAKIAANLLDERFGGSMALEMVIDAGEANGLHDPELLGAIDRAHHTLDGLETGEITAGPSLSLVDVIKEIHQALNEGRPEARVVPEDRTLVSQELILFENSGSDDLQDVVDTEFRMGRFTIRTPMVDALFYEDFAEEVERIMGETLPEDVEASLTGMMMVSRRTFGASMETIVRSYGIALLVITPLMMLLLGSFRLGLVAMLPNLFPIFLTLGLMGWTGQPLEMFSLLIGSVALGLAVDDTIHFMHGFRRTYAATGSVEIAVRETLQTTGQALLFTSVVLSCGFLVYLFSEMNNLWRFGLFTAFSVTMAFFADVLFAPALMKIMARWSSVARDKSE